MNKQNTSLDPNAYLTFIKIFLVYVFFEFVLINLSPSGTLDNAIKLLGDGLTVGFLIYTFLRKKGLTIVRGQSLGIALAFVGIAAISTVINQGTLFDFFMGMRYLFRYYIIYLLSFSYDLRSVHFKRLSDFLIASFYVEFPLFLGGYLFFGTVSVLYQNYLLTAIYLNAIFMVLLFDGKLNFLRLAAMALVILQAFLSTSRLAVIGLAITFIVFLLLTSKQRRIKLFAAVGGILLIGGSFALFLLPPEFITESDTAKKFMNLRFEDAEDSNFRFYLFTTYLGLSVRTVNLFGDGPNTFGDVRYHRDYHYQYGFDDRTVAYAADSHFVILLMQYGFLGLALYSYLLYSLIKNTKKEFLPAVLPFMAFLMLAIFSIPALSIRISSFLMFALLSLTKRWH